MRVLSKAALHCQLNAAGDQLFHSVKSSVTISLVPEAKGGPFVFWDGLVLGCEQAARLGFDAVEIFAPSAQAIQVEELRGLLQRHGLQAAAFGTGGGWVIRRLHLCQPDAESRRQAREFIGQIIDLAGQFGASAIIGSMQGRFEGTVSRDQALQWLREGLNELGARAQERGQPLLYEPLNRYETNLFNRATDAVEFLRSLQTTNVRILADLFHMNIEEACMADAICTYGSFLGHLHFVDSNRRPAGLGHIQYEPIVAALKEIGYTGYVSAEALPYPTSVEAARQTIEQFRKYFKRHATT